MPILTGDVGSDWRNGLQFVCPIIKFNDDYSLL